MPRSEASHLGLYCLPMSYKRDLSELIETVYIHCDVAKIGNPFLEYFSHFLLSRPTVYIHDV